MIAKCVGNTQEFTKAYNVMIGLRITMKKISQILSSELILSDESINAQIKDDFKEIIRITAELLNSRKLQFFNESKGVYNNCD